MYTTTRHVRVRRAESGDSRPLAELLQQYFHEAGLEHFFSGDEVLAALREPAFGFSVAEDSSGLLGCVSCRRLASIEGACECKRLYVRPDARRRGVASMLMEAAETMGRSEGCAWIYLDTKQSFQAAIRLYEERGYTLCERYNSNPEAALFFRKQLR